MKSLASHYRSIETRLLVEEAPDYAELVVPNGNADEAVHRWFHVKEAFSHRLLTRVLKDLGRGDCKHPVVLDPYAGSGTTAASLAAAVRDGTLAGGEAVGVECNGFLHLVSRGKLLASQRPPRRLGEIADRVAKSAVDVQHPVEIPELSTFRNAKFFDLADLVQLARIRDAIHAVESAGADEVATLLLLLALGASIEPVSNLRRDGRALRYVEKQTRPLVVECWRSKVAQIEADLPLKPVPVKGAVHRGDARSLDVLERGWECDLVLFSPPYPNNIDYTEVYKLENWLLGFIANNNEFRQQRLRTAYSHPSILRDDPLPATDLTPEENDGVSRCVEPIIAALPQDRYAVGRRRMFRGYAVDMFRTLRASRSVLRRGGDIVYVVGNSAHGRDDGSFVVAADLLLAELAEYAGLCVERVAVARYPRRRSVDSEFVRESVVFLKG